MTLGKLAWTSFAALVALLVTWEAGRFAGLGPVTGPTGPGLSNPAGSPGPEGPGRVVAEGRVVAYPGAEVVVGTEMAGMVVAMPVEELDEVRRGDLLAELRSDDIRASRDEAAARIAEADADIAFFGRESRRAEQLRARMAGSQVELDGQIRSLESARARRAAALARRDRFEAMLRKARVVAPIDGVVLARRVHPGETVEAGAPVVVVADLGRLRVEAEVDESDDARVALGAAVRITAEGHPGVSWRGHVEEIPAAIVGRRLRPTDPSRPTDLRVLPVKIAIDEPAPLRLGKRVDVEIEVAAPAD